MKKKSKLIIGFIAILSLTGCSNSDDYRIEESEKEIIKQIKLMRSEREKEIALLLEICSKGRILRYSGYENPAELANKVLQIQKKETELQSVLDKSIEVEQTYIRKITGNR